MTRTLTNLFGLFVYILSTFTLQAQTHKSNGYVFTNIKTLPATPVKDQGHTSTCWSFSTISFLESELLRQGKPEVDLSEMYIVWHTWDKKAIKYMRLHGNMTFAGGGAANDVLDMIKEYGIVPENEYSGRKDNNLKHNHTELDMVLTSYVENLAKIEKQTLSSAWLEGFDKILDSYLGNLPNHFNYNGQKYSPKSFADYLGINPDDYIMITSFNHHPFYSRFILEVPDNWSYGYVYNLPLEEMMQVIKYSIENNYSVNWAADYTEKGFSFQKGIAILPNLSKDYSTSLEWQEALSKPCEEIEVTQELRQEQFDNYATTDDHGMHIVGIAKDEDGKLFYYIKNSWGTNNIFNGYMYISEPYMKLKTISIMVNKNAIPISIRQKLGIIK